MDIKVCRYFTTLARTKSYARASRELFLTTQGLSTSIKRLEATMGVPLISNGPGTLELTEYGRIFYQRACAMQNEYDLMLDEINTLQRRRSGNILFAVSTGLTNSLPHDAIERFNEQNTTGAHVEITRDLVDYDCESNLYEKTCDFALLNDPIDHTMFSSLPILKDRMHLVVKSDCPLAPKAMICASDLNGLTIACVTPGEFRTSKKNEPIIREAAPDAKFIYSTEMIAVLEAAMQGRAAALMPRPHATLFEKEGLVGIPVEELTWGFGVAWRTDRTLSPQDEEFLAFLKQYQKFYC